MAFVSERAIFAHQILMKYINPLKLLPVSENRRPPYWISTSSFDFDVCVVIGISLSIIRTAYYIRELELMKLIFAVLDV